jgi:hypothetical protein
MRLMARLSLATTLAVTVGCETQAGKAERAVRLSDDLTLARSRLAGLSRSWDSVAGVNPDTLRMKAIFDSINVAKIEIERIEQQLRDIRK